MKRFLAAILAVILLVCFGAAFADDEADKDAVEMPAAGMRFTPPEAYRDSKGIVVTDGAIMIDSDVYYAYWIYCAMTEEELQEVFTSPDSDAYNRLKEMFHVFSIGGGKKMDDISGYFSSPLPEEYVREIGQAGDCTFYLFMEGPDKEFADRIGEEYAEEYTKLAGMADEIAAAFTFYEPVDPDAALVGTKVEFTTKDLDGNEVSSADIFAKNEVTMINIWATWCGPCVNELAGLQKIHAGVQERGGAVVGLLDDTKLDQARQLMSDNGVEYTVILAPDNLMDLFPIKGYPTSYFIGRDGTILTKPVIGAYLSEYEPIFNTYLSK